MQIKIQTVVLIREGFTKIGEFWDLVIYEQNRVLWPKIAGSSFRLVWPGGPGGGG